MKPVIVKNCIIGDGNPKIAVPIAAVTADEIIMAAHTAFSHADSCVDLVEWRVDFYDHADDIPSVMELLKKIRHIIRSIPLLFTFRTQTEGGVDFNYSRSYYVMLVQEAILSHNIDIVDIEVFREGSEKLAEIAHNNSIVVMMSHHIFDHTPPQRYMEILVKLMHSSHADILKLAFMPHTTADVLTVLDFTVSYFENDKSVAPLVTISMGKLGVLSRISGVTFGSAISFGTLNDVSAPGQISANKLRYIMDCLK